MRLLFIMTGAIATSLMPQWMLILRQELNSVKFRSILTPNASKMVSSSALEAISGGPVYEFGYDSSRHSHPAIHMELVDWADAIAVVPATYNTIVKMSLGLADNLPLTVLAYADCPVMVAPAVGVVPAASCVYRDAKKKLELRGVRFVAAKSATMETYDGEMVEPQGGDGAPDLRAVLAALTELVHNEI